MNKLSCIDDEYRDSSIVEVIAEMLNKYDRVFVIYGAGHHVVEHKVLREMMGEPIIRGISAHAPIRQIIDKAIADLLKGVDAAFVSCDIKYSIAFVTTSNGSKSAFSVLDFQDSQYAHRPGNWGNCRR